MRGGFFFNKIEDGDGDGDMERRGGKGVFGRRGRG